MKNKIIELLKNKNIAILGFGREGKSTYQFIRDNLDMKLTIIDKLDIRNEELIQNDHNLDIIYGDNYLNNLDNFDLIIKTPGISLKDIDTTNINITSQIELILEVARNRVIGVTGTKGKSTTSSLIYSILKENNVDTILAGNIGIPVLSRLDEITDKTIIVLEMSSHQLEFLNYSPHIGVILNLFEDHLDHAGSVKHYHESKLNMFKYQTSDDYMLYCSDNDTLNMLVQKNNFKGKKYTINLIGDADIDIKNSMINFQGNPEFSQYIKRNLLGDHNLENIMVAYAVSKILKLNMDKTIKAINDFKPLSYRLELIGTVNNVKYYVDTLATIPDATKEAIEAIPDIDTLIFGGMDRGISYDGFAEYLKNTNINNFICMPTTAHEIAKSLPKEKVYIVNTLEEACTIAKRVTKKGSSCILSPAAASYEHFKNYADKGDKFKEYILN